MSDEIGEIQRRLAYLQTVRKVGYWPRTIGFACCLVGAILLIWASQNVPGGAFSPFGYTALSVIFAGWGLFGYSLIVRTRYVRAHPYQSQA
jgi:hypothetical protein